jgi:hypothetical protein
MTTIKPYSDQRNMNGECELPKGPSGQKRPADVIGAAVLVGRLATGDETETPQKQRPQAAAGGAARARILNSEERSKIAKKASNARWSNPNENRKGAL